MTRRLPKEVKKLREGERHQERIQLLQLYGYEYISGYKNCENKIKVKCLCCNKIFEMSYHNIVSISKGIGTNKNRTIACPNCYELRKDHTKDIQKLLDKQRIRLSKQLKKKKCKTYKIYIRECRECGKTFVTAIPNKNNCSSECSKKWQSNHKDRKKRYKDITIDRGITLTKLYNISKGKCAICGEQCDINANSNDDLYPSIDHIIPICKGGLHSWNNVQLAHRLCNSMKGTKVL